MRGRREKVFGPGRAVPLDRKREAARIVAYARAWDRRRAPPAGAREAEPWGAPPWTSWAPCCGCFTMPAPAAASPATRRSPQRAAAPAPPSPRPSKLLGVPPVCSPGRTASPGSASVAVTCSAATTGAGGDLAGPTPMAQTQRGWSPSAFKSNGTDWNTATEIRILKAQSVERTEAQSIAWEMSRSRRGCGTATGSCCAEGHHDRPQLQIQRNKGVITAGRRGRPWPNGRSVR